MEEKNFKIGDEIHVVDPGLQMLERFRPKEIRPQSYGWVAGFFDNGDIAVLFPIGNDDPNEHSQLAPYPERQIVKLEWVKDWPINTPNFDDIVF